MRIKIIKKATNVLSITALIITVSFAIYAAQPWGDNYAYKTILDYFSLLLIISWAVSPYVYLFISTQQHSASLQAPLIGRFIITILICAGGTAIIVDTIFIHTDAQGGLVFLFLPVYQLVILGAYETVSRLVWRKNAR